MSRLKVRWKCSETGERGIVLVKNSPDMYAETVKKLSEMGGWKTIYSVENDCEEED